MSLTNPISWSAVGFDSGMSVIDLPNNSMIVPVDGLYNVSAKLSSDEGAVPEIYILLHINGVGSAWSQYGLEEFTGEAVFPLPAMLNAFLNLEAGDVLTIYGNGDGLDVGPTIETGQDNSYMSLRRVR